MTSTADATDPGLVSGGDPRTMAILDAVVRAFHAGGYEGVNLRSVAREARVSLATIYEMFSSRDELCVAAM